MLRIQIPSDIEQSREEQAVLPALPHPACFHILYCIIFGVTVVHPLASFLASTVLKLTDHELCARLPTDSLVTLRHTWSGLLSAAAGTASNPSFPPWT